jgi:hypothetical protein
VLDLKRRADHSLMPRSTPPVWLRLDARLAPRRLSSLARSKWQPCSRCWALAARNDGQASACAVGRPAQNFLAGCSRCITALGLAGFVPDAVVEDAEHGWPSRAGSRYHIGRSWPFSSRATGNFSKLSPASPWTRSAHSEAWTLI